MKNRLRMCMYNSKMRNICCNDCHTYESSIDIDVTTCLKENHVNEVKQAYINVILGTF